MFEKAEKIIIILLVILIVIYFLQQKEHFVSNEFRLRVKGTPNTFLYNDSYDGFVTRSANGVGAYYTLGVNNSLICARGYTTSIYNHRCLYYKVKNNPNQYLVDKNVSYASSSTNCSQSKSQTDFATLYFENTNGIIYYMSGNVKYYLSTDLYNKNNQKYYKFSSDINKALKLEKA